MADTYDDDAVERVGDLALGGQRGGRNARGGGGGGRGGGRRGGGRGGKGDDYVLSKALSTLLRHQAHAAGIKLDDEGFAPLDRVVSFDRSRLVPCRPPPPPPPHPTTAPMAAHQSPEPDGGRHQDGGSGEPEAAIRAEAAGRPG